MWVSKAISTSGLLADSYTYEAFGELEHSSGSTHNPFRYTGEQWDPNLGFYYLRARYYNPSNGRFPTMDTYQGRIHEPATLHKYLYVHGDPVNLVDPSGHVGILSFGARAVGYVAKATVVTFAIGRNRNKIADTIFQMRSLDVVRRSIALGELTDGAGFNVATKNINRTGTYQDALSELGYIGRGLKFLGARVTRENVTIDYRKRGSRIRRSASVRRHGTTVANAHLQINGVGGRARTYKIRFR